MAIRALLIKTPKRGASKDYISVNFEPLGLTYIAAFVREHSDHTISILDAQAESAGFRRVDDGLLQMGMRAELISERIRAFSPRVVGITALFEVQQVEVINVARLVKSISPDIVVVVGGLDAGVRFREYLSSGVVDLVVRGDGEEPFLEILNRVEEGEALSGIAGTCEVVGDGEVRRNADWVRRVPFNEYPYPARDLLPREAYDNRRNQKASFPFARRRPALLMQASRGCRLKCAFCDIVAVQDRWNEHSPEYVVNEIEHCMENYGTKEVVFVDDNFMLDKKWVMKICELIVARQLEIALDVMPGIAVWTLSESMVDTMVEAGLYRICMPVESGNPQTIKFIKKPVDLDHVTRSIDYCNRKGLYTFANLIIGFPYETEDDIRITLNWGKNSGLDAINYYVAEPFQGARMYPIYQQNGWLSYESSYKLSWRTKYFTREELERIALEATREYMKSRLMFYLDPRNARRYLLPKLSSPAKLRYAVQIAKYVVFSGYRPTYDLDSVAILDRFKQLIRWQHGGTTTT